MLDNVIDLIKWVYRTRSVWSVFLKAGIKLMVLGIGGGLLFEFAFAVTDKDRSIDFGVLGTSTPTWMATITFLLGLLFCVLALLIGHSDWKRSRELLKHQVCLVIEMRGLRDIPATPLLEYAQKQTPIACHPLTIDVREALYDGQISDPDRALSKVKTINERIVEAGQQRNPGDLSLVFGGLAPVPFTFLVGLLIDDERYVEILDWNRNKRNWSSLDSGDDGERFVISEMTNVNSPSVSLCLSVSYEIAPELVQSALPNQPIISMNLSSRSPDNHWSEIKQQALGQQFTETILKLQSNGVQKIDLFLSAQMSFVFRLGALYDKRNMPPILVYQYEPGVPPSYPWAVAMPVNGMHEATIVKSMTVSLILCKGFLQN